ncbi:MAG TPA: type II toxin-antitoxin system PemK/MazF family toxin [Chloroflexota bacterium]|jgi:mRNA-degrading endonuclease toxin of MazEF toxin-antitoxin module
MVRGEIFFMDFAPRSGSEQMGRRPGVVVSHDVFSANPRWRSVSVVPLTTAERWQRPSPTTVLFAAGEFNLPRPCAGLAHQVTTLDKGKIIEPAVGRLDAGKLAEVETALRNYLRL